MCYGNKEMNKLVFIFITIVSVRGKNPMNSQFSFAIGCDHVEKANQIFLVNLLSQKLSNDEE